MHPNRGTTDLLERLQYKRLWALCFCRCFHRCLCQTLAVCIAGLMLLTTTAQAKPHRHQAGHRLKNYATTSATLRPAHAYAGYPQAIAFAQETAEQLALDPRWVQQTVGRARYIPAVVKLMQPPTKTFVKNWRVYRSRFIEPVRIQAGVQFWQTHQATLARAQAQYGVPIEIMVGILGVETRYGQDMGTFRVMDALATLAFDFPAAHPRAAQRSAFFRQELQAFLKQTYTQGGDPGVLRGSYAGAMGLPQFMPSSLARYAVDFDGDGTIDLFNSPADAIGSVAHYFQQFNWKPGMPTHYAVQWDALKLDLPALTAPDIVPTFSVAELAGKGALVESGPTPPTGPLAVIELFNGGQTPSYVVGTDNFYALTRYNQSSYYAMAVIELGRAVAEKMADSNQP